MVSVDKLLSGVTSFSPPLLSDTGGRLNSSNEDLFEFTHRHVPKPSTRLNIPAWSAVRWRAGLFTREPASAESQHWPTPCCFALRDANAGRLQCLRSCSSVWQWAPTGSLPRKKPPRESRGPQWNTCFTKGLQASTSSLVSLTETLAQCSSEWKQDSGKTTETLQHWWRPTWITTRCWECLLVQNPSQHFKSAMWAQRWPWANVIWSDKEMLFGAVNTLRANYFK